MQDRKRSYKRIHCPVVQGPPNRKAYRVRGDGAIFYSGAWRHINSVLKKVEWSRIRDRIRCEKSPAYREELRARKAKYDKSPKAKQTRKEYYERNKRKLNRARVERRGRCREMARKVWREWYARNRERYLKAEYERRQKRDPIRGLYTAAFALERGEISQEECARRFDTALARLNEICSNGVRSKEKIRAGHAKCPGQRSQKSKGNHETKNGPI